MRAQVSRPCCLREMNSRWGERVWKGGRKVWGGRRGTGPWGAGSGVKRAGMSPQELSGGRRAAYGG